MTQLRPQQPNRLQLHQALPVHVHRLQTEADLAQVEQVPRHEAPLEGQDTTEQRHLALLAHAVHQGTRARVFLHLEIINLPPRAIGSWSVPSPTPWTLTTTARPRQGPSWRWVARRGSSLPRQISKHQIKELSLNEFCCLLRTPDQ